MPLEILHLIVITNDTETPAIMSLPGHISKCVSLALNYAVEILNHSYFLTMIMKLIAFVVGLILLD